MNGTRIITVPERGHRDIDEYLWKYLSEKADFWHLIDGKILSIKQLSPGRFRLLGSSYVGRAIIGDVLVEISEKIEGALAVLLHYATSSAFRIGRLHSPVSEAGDLAALLVHEYLKAVREYASAGRERQYIRTREIGSLAGGRINITRSLSLRARGLRHLLAFERNVLTYNVLKNRIILAGLREVESMSRVIDMSPSDLSMARSFSLLFADCLNAEVLFGMRERFIGDAERLRDQSTTIQDRDLLALAAVILSRVSFDKLVHSSDKAPRTWFLNLERLFETAARRTLSEVCAVGIQVNSTPVTPKPIFQLEAERFTANPDLVVRRGTDVIAVGDIKYKDWSGSAEASDLYQLMVHAAAFKARVAFLIFPGDRLNVRELGDSATGCRTWLFSVNIQTLREDLTGVLSTVIPPQ